MKAIIRIFNIIIMALSAVATILVYTTTPFAFKSNIGLDVNSVAKFLPETSFTEDVDIANLLGTDVIHVGINFELDLPGVQKMMNGDTTVINDTIINKNIEGIVDTLHEPINLITEHTVKSALKKTIKTEITTQVDAARTKYADEHPELADSIPPTETIMEEVGMDEVYFDNFTIALYNEADRVGATVDTLTDVLYEQVDEALARAEESGMTDSSGFAEEKKVEIKNNLVNVLTELKLVDSSNNLKRISQIVYIYLADYLKQELQGKVSDPAELEQKTTENSEQYSERLLKAYVLAIMPQVFYQAVSYVCLGLYIGLYVFTGIWVLLFVITLIKTFSKNKPWTIFGPWFWIVGILQVVLGFGLTFAGKILLPKIDVSGLGLPIKSLIIAPRTYVLIPSIIFMGLIVFGIIYAIIKSGVKRQNRTAAKEAIQ